MEDFRLVMERWHNYVLNIPRLLNLKFVFLYKNVASWFQRRQAFFVHDHLKNNIYCYFNENEIADKKGHNMYVIYKYITYYFFALKLQTRYFSWKYGYNATNFGYRTNADIVAGYQTWSSKTTFSRENGELSVKKIYIQRKNVISPYPLVEYLINKPM